MTKIKYVKQINLDNFFEGSGLPLPFSNQLLETS